MSPFNCMCVGATRSTKIMLSFRNSICWPCLGLGHMQLSNIVSLAKVPAWQKCQLGTGYTQARQQC